VYRRGLVGVEGFPVCARFDPDRRSQLAVAAAVDTGAHELHLELLDSLEPGVSVRRSCTNPRAASTLALTTRRVILHALTVPSEAKPVLSNRALHPRLTDCSRPLCSKGQTDG
jgi:hypothetical protein